MSEETKDIQEPEVNEGHEDLREVLKQKDSEIENLKKIAQGQDKKNSELFKEIESLKKIVSEKDNSKKTVEEQLIEMQKKLEEREKVERAKEKESIVNRIIAKHKLDPEFDFDFLHKFETVDAIEENALKRVEYYKKIKDDDFKTRVAGSVPKKGTAVDVNNLENKSLFELMQIVKQNPDMEDAVNREVKSRSNRS